jgi:hypothetical protein
MDTPLFIQRPQPDIPWTPEMLPSIADLFYADDVPGSDNTAIASWTGRVNGKVFSQASGTKQPTVQVNEVNGHRTLLFDGTDDDLRSTDIGITTYPFTIVWVKSDANTANKFALLWTNGVVNQGLGIFPTTDYERFDNGGFWRYEEWRAGYVTQVITLAAASELYWLDGAAGLTGPGVGPIPPTSAIGLCANHAEASEFMNSNVAFLGFLSGSIGETDRQRFEGWAAHTFGTTGSLPALHPYKSAAPMATQDPLTALLWV